MQIGMIGLDRMGANSHYKSDITRAKRLASADIYYLDVGTSGGVWGLERGYCLMVGGDPDSVSGRPEYPTPREYRTHGAGG